MGLLNQTGSGLRFWQRQPRAEEITGYRVGDVHSSIPVHITVESTLVGNVNAPRVIVSGLLTGHVVTQSLQITETGSVWGNVYTMACDINEGGRLQGWVTAVNEETYLRLHASGIVPNGKTEDITTNLPDEAPPAVLASRDPNYLIALQQLQADAATALAARTELEQDFDRRLSEVAGDATARIAQLQNDLNTTAKTLTTTKDEASQLTQLVSQQEAQLTRQSNELNATRDQLQERKEELTNTRQALAERNQKYDELAAIKTNLDAKLEAANQTIDELNERNHSIETALQASFQHSSEQEDSLIRWQELAEATEKKAAELERELANGRMQSEEATNTIEMLRAQRRQTEIELEKALDELNELRHQPTKPISSGNIVELQMKLVDLEEKSQENYEQMLWYKASAEDTRHSLEQIRKELTQQSQLIGQYESELAAKQELITRWKNEVAKLRQIATNQHKKLQQYHTGLNQFKEKAGAEIGKLKEHALQAQLKSEATELDFNRLQTESRQQGERLAEMQMLLVERDLEIERAKELIQKQTDFIQNMKQVTNQRIQKLQQALATYQTGNGNQPLA